MDLSPLRHEITFGLNRIYLLFPEVGFTTTYLVSVNDLVLQQCADEIKALPLPKQLFPVWRRGVFAKRKGPAPSSGPFAFSGPKDPKWLPRVAEGLLSRSIFPTQLGGNYPLLWGRIPRCGGYPLVWATERRLSVDVHTEGQPVHKSIFLIVRGVDAHQRQRVINHIRRSRQAVHPHAAPTHPEVDCLGDQIAQFDP